MNYLHTNLKITSTEINDYSDSVLPEVMYRDLGSLEAKESFLNGNIWFCGPSQNRFFAFPEQRDEWEYRNMISSAIFDYSCSFSTELIGKKVNSITRHKEVTQKISWFNKSDLITFIPHVPSIALLTKLPTHEDETFTFNIVGLGGLKIKYDTKITHLEHEYNPIEVAQNAYSKDIRFEDEKELRLSITGTLDISEDNASLQHLVQYIKLYCPHMSNYCQSVK